MLGRPKGQRELDLQAAGQNEDRKQENELDECERDQHRGLDLADGFGLSAHALHRAVADEAEADGNAHCGESDTESEYMSCHCVFLSSSDVQVI